MLIENATYLTRLAVAGENTQQRQGYVPIFLTQTQAKRQGYVPIFSNTSKKLFLF